MRLVDALVKEYVMVGEKIEVYRKKLTNASMRHLQTAPKWCKKIYSREKMTWEECIGRYATVISLRHGTSLVLSVTTTYKQGWGRHRYQ